MLNQVVLVGRITDEVKTEIIKIAVPRPYKNSEGAYDTDFIPVVLIGGILDNAKEYCRKGDMIGVRGRIESKEDELVIIAEKVTFLSSNKGDNNE